LPRYPGGEHRPPERPMHTGGSIHGPSPLTKPHTPEPASHATDRDFRGMTKSCRGEESDPQDATASNVVPVFLIICAKQLFPGMTSDPGATGIFCFDHSRHHEPSPPVDQIMSWEQHRPGSSLPHVRIR
jgi:hypothetical protein